MSDHDDNHPLKKIIKLMGMTQSSHDAEALTALRLATAHLKQQGWTWDSILRDKIKILPDPFANIPTPVARSTSRGGYTAAPAAPPPPPKQFDNRDEMEKYFGKLEFRKLPDYLNTRIRSIRQTWDKNGFLLYQDYDFLKTTANSRRRY